MNFDGSKKQATAFYSWQSDLPNRTNRGFISDCLDKAIKELNRVGSGVLEADRDTQGVSGTPGIAQTIFDKIDECSAFVADVSIINSGSDQRKTPNPNVLIELGYAAKAVGWERIICVANTAYGAIEELPFDLRGRRILDYSLADDEGKVTARDDLKCKLRNALDSMLAGGSQTSSQVVSVGFADPETEELLDAPITVSIQRIEGVDADELPDFGGPSKVYLGNKVLSIPSTISMQQNREYYRDLGRYILMNLETAPIIIAISNLSGSLLTGVRLVADVSPNDKTLLLDSLVDLPSRQRDLVPAISNMHSLHSKLSIEQKASRLRATIDFGKIQIGETAFSPKIYLGPPLNGQVLLSGNIFSDQAPPQSYSLEVVAEVESKARDNDAFMELIEQYDEMLYSSTDSEDEEDE